MIHNQFDQGPALIEVAKEKGRAFFIVIVGRSIYAGCQESNSGRSRGA